MAPNLIIVLIELLSALATGALVVGTLKPCRAAGVPYLLAVPAGFALIATALAMRFIGSVTGDLPGVGLILDVIYLLLLTQGFLFLAFTYARRTRLRFIGESRPLELGAGILVTFVFVESFLTGSATPSILMPANAELFMRLVIVAALLYLVYETTRNWKLTRRASEGMVVVGFALLLIGQVGFILAWEKLGPVASFLGYEGRILGLFVLLSITYFGIRKGDFVTVLKRLGLAAPAH